MNQKKVLEEIRNIKRPEFKLPLHKSQLKRALLNFSEAKSSSVFSKNFFINQLLFMKSIIFTKKFGFITLAVLTLALSATLSNPSIYFPQVKAKQILDEVSQKVFALSPQELAELEKRFPASIVDTLKEAEKASDLKYSDPKDSKVNMKFFGKSEQIKDLPLLEYTNSKAEKVALLIGKDGLPMTIFITSSDGSLMEFATDIYSAPSDRGQEVKFDAATGRIQVDFPEVSSPDEASIKAIGGEAEVLEKEDLKRLNIFKEGGLIRFSL